MFKHMQHINFARKPVDTRSARYQLFVEQCQETMDILRSKLSAWYYLNGPHCFAQKLVYLVCNNRQLHCSFSWSRVTCSCGPVSKRFLWLVWKNRWRVSLLPFPFLLSLSISKTFSPARSYLWLDSVLNCPPPSLVSRNGFLSYDEFITFFKFPDSKLIQVISKIVTRPCDCASKCIMHLD